MKKEILSKIVVLALVFAVVIYVVVVTLTANMKNANDIETEVAVKYNYSEKISADGVIIRDETVIPMSSSNGVKYYTVEDGDKVAVNSVVAKVFADETDALFYNKVQEIDSKISVLESLNTPYDNAITDSAIDKQIYLNLSSFIKSVNQKDTEDTAQAKDTLVYSINQRQRIVGTVKDFNKEISALKNEKAKYENAGANYISEITAPKAGYFVAEVDGYEEVFNYKNVKNITVDSFEKSYNPKEVSDNVVGKIVSGLDWYVVCRLSADDALSLSHSKSDVKIIFSSAADEPIPVELVALNQESKQSEGVAVFKCNYMNDTLSSLRNETVQIVINSFEGVRVTKSALHDDYVEVVNAEGEPTGEKKRTQGVYILHGSELMFREVSILFAGSDFVIVDINPDTAMLKSGETIIINDQVVIEGEDLYDGKIIK